MPGTPTDSLQGKQDTNAIKVFSYSHIFTNHELRIKSQEPELIKKTGMVWPVFVFTLSFILLVTIRVTSARRFFVLLKAYFSLAAARQLMREDYKLNKASSVLFSIVFVLHFSYFLLKINQFYGYIHYSFNDLFFFLLTALCVLSVYFFKIVAARLLARLMLAANETDEYIFNIFISTNAIGLFLFPVVICLEYANLPAHYLLMAGLFVLLLFYVIRLLKGIVIAYVSGRFSVFHLFLYLCALEILPLIVVIKLLVSKIF
ncbi:MAG: hypothetical protein K0S33_3684 [Bacteroidetes bacterium]|jgi:hypothetical protein|nr:hypothetical protein [Bacteroidota bacterium]